MPITEAQRRQRALEWERGLDYGSGRGRREIERGDSRYDAAVLGDELAGGHFDPLDNDWAYSFSGAGPEGSGGAFRFKDRHGRETSGTEAQRAAARADMSQWEQQGGGAGSGSGGGGLFGGGGGTGSLSDRVNALLRERLDGNSQFFGADATRKAKGGAFETIQRRLRTNNRQAAEEAIDSGQGEGDAYRAELNANRRGASEEYGDASRDVDSEMRMGAFQAQSDAMQSFLEQTRAEAEQAIAREGNAINRERIAADQRIAERQIQSQIDLAQKGMDAERASGRANRDWQDQNAERNRQWDLEDYYRDQANRQQPRV